MVLKFLQFISENLSQDEIIDLYSHFIRILKIHENHFYNSEKISSDPEFKSDVNKIFYKMSEGKKPLTENLYNKVHEYEKKLYNDEKITPEDNFGCSMWDVCDVIVEDPETLNRNSYIQNFSEADVYVEKSPRYSSSDFGEIDAKLDQKISTISEVDKLVDQAFEIAKEKYEEEIDIIDFAIEILTGYMDKYPQYQEEIEEVIEDWEEFRKRF